jgi:hypothetical protein
MITIQEMSEKYKRQLEPHLEAIIGKLMKKGMDANAFISQEVKGALWAICTHSSEQRIVPLLLNFAN